MPDEEPREKWIMVVKFRGDVEHYTLTGCASWAQHQLELTKRCFLGAEISLRRREQT